MLDSLRQLTRQVEPRLAALHHALAHPDSLDPAALGALAHAKPRILRLALDHAEAFALTTLNGALEAADERTLGHLATVLANHAVAPISSASAQIVLSHQAARDLLEAADAAKLYKDPATEEGLANDPFAGRFRLKIDGETGPTPEAKLPRSLLIEGGHGHAQPSITLLGSPRIWYSNNHGRKRVTDGKPSVYRIPIENGGWATDYFVMNVRTGHPAAFVHYNVFTHEIVVTQGASVESDRHPDAARYIGHAHATIFGPRNGHVIEQ